MPTVGYGRNGNGAQPIIALGIRILRNGKLTVKIDDRDIIFKDIEQSYYYEGYKEMMIECEIKTCLKKAFA